MRIYEYQDYKKYLNDQIKKFPSGGHGVLKRMADAIRAPQSTISLVFKGNRNLTQEQAVDIADFLGLNYTETEYFLLMVDLSRAGNQKLKLHLQKRMDIVKKKASELRNRVSPKSEIGDNEKYVFYSEWYYCAIRLLSGIPGFQTPQSIADHFQLPLRRVKGVLDFLVQAKLCEEKNGKYLAVEKSTHIGSDDPLVFRHHGNWRTLALKRITEAAHLRDFETCISLPCTTSEDGLRKIREILLKASVEASAVIEEGKDEKLAFIGIDLLCLN